MNKRALEAVDYAEFATLVEQGKQIVNNQIECKRPYWLSMSIDCYTSANGNGKHGFASFPLDNLEEITLFLSNHPFCDFECDIYIEIEDEAPERSEVMIVKERNILTLLY